MTQRAQMISLTMQVLRRSPESVTWRVFGYVQTLQDWRARDYLARRPDGFARELRAVLDSRALAWLHAAHAPFAVCALADCRKPYRVRFKHHFDGYCPPCAYVAQLQHIHDCCDFDELQDDTGSCAYCDRTFRQGGQCVALFCYCDQYDQICADCIVSTFDLSRPLLPQVLAYGDPQFLCLHRTPAQVRADTALQQALGLTWDQGPALWRFMREIIRPAVQRRLRRERAEQHQAWLRHTRRHALLTTLCGRRPECALRRSVDRRIVYRLAAFCLERPESGYDSCADSCSGEE